MGSGTQSDPRKPSSWIHRQLRTLRTWRSIRTSDKHRRTIAQNLQAMCSIHNALNRVTTAQKFQLWLRSDGMNKSWPYFLWFVPFAFKIAVDPRPPTCLEVILTRITCYYHWHLWSACLIRLQLYCFYFLFCKKDQVYYEDSSKVQKHLKNNKITFRSMVHEMTMAAVRTSSWRVAVVPPISEPT